MMSTLSENAHPQQQTRGPTTVHVFRKAANNNNTTNKEKKTSQTSTNNLYFTFCRLVEFRMRTLVRSLNISYTLYPHSLSKDGCICWRHGTITNLLTITPWLPGNQNLRPPSVCRAAFSFATILSLKSSNFFMSLIADTKFLELVSKTIPGDTTTQRRVGSTTTCDTADSRKRFCNLPPIIISSSTWCTVCDAQMHGSRE